MRRSTVGIVEGSRHVGGSVASSAEEVESPTLALAVAVDGHRLGLTFRNKHSIQIVIVESIGVTCGSLQDAIIGHTVVCGSFRSVDSDGLGIETGLVVVEAFYDVLVAYNRCLASEDVGIETTRDVYGLGAKLLIACQVVGHCLFCCPGCSNVLSQVLVGRSTNGFHGSVECALLCIGSLAVIILALEVQQLLIGSSFIVLECCSVNDVQVCHLCLTTAGIRVHLNHEVLVVVGNCSCKVEVLRHAALGGHVAVLSGIEFDPRRSICRGIKSTGEVAAIDGPRLPVASCVATCITACRQLIVERNDASLQSPNDIAGGKVAAPLGARLSVEQVGGNTVAPCLSYR